MNILIPAPDVPQRFYGLGKQRTGVALEPVLPNWETIHWLPKLNELIQHHLELCWSLYGNMM